MTTTLHRYCSSFTGCQCQNEWLSNFASWCIAVCMVSALNTSRRTSGSCPRFILASDCTRPPVPTSWFLPHAGLHLATEHSRSQQLERGTRCRPVSPPHHLCHHSGDSWRHFFSSDNCVNNTNYCVVVLKCLALSTALILANWTELNWTELNWIPVSTTIAGNITASVTSVIWWFSAPPNAYAFVAPLIWRWLATDMTCMYVLLCLFCLCLYEGRVQDFSLGQNRRAEGRERGVEGTATQFPPARGLRSAVSSSSRVRGGAPTAQRFSTIFSTHDALSWHYNVVNCGLSCSHWGGDKISVTPLPTPLTVLLCGICFPFYGSCTWNKLDWSIDTVRHESNRPS